MRKYNLIPINETSACTFIFCAVALTIDIKPIFLKLALTIEKAPFKRSNRSFKGALLKQQLVRIQNSLAKKYRYIEFYIAFLNIKVWQKH